jgi:hypothetical protein
MKQQSIYKNDITREIGGVVYSNDDRFLIQELEEYVLTKELLKPKLLPELFESLAKANIREHIVNNTLANHTLQEWIEKRKVKFFCADFAQIYQALNGINSFNFSERYVSLRGTTSYMTQKFAVTFRNFQKSREGYKFFECFLE